MLKIEVYSYICTICVYMRKLSMCWSSSSAENFSNPQQTCCFDPSKPSRGGCPIRWNQWVTSSGRLWRCKTKGTFASWFWEDFLTKNSNSRPLVVDPRTYPGNWRKSFHICMVSLGVCSRISWHFLGEFFFAAGGFRRDGDVRGDFWWETGDGGRVVEKLLVGFEWMRSEDSFLGLQFY